MKITRNIPDQLIIENTPWVLSLLLGLGGLLFVAIGLSLQVNGIPWGLAFVAASLIPFGLLLAFARRLQILFLRPEREVIIRRRSLLSRSSVTHDLSDVHEAIVQSSRANNSTTYRVALNLTRGQSAGIHPLTLSYDNFNDHARTVTTINAWLAQAR